MLTTLTLWAAIESSAARASTADCPTGQIVVLSSLPVVIPASCDVDGIEFRYGGLGVTAPGPGQGVAGTALHWNGRTRLLFADATERGALLISNVLSDLDTHPSSLDGFDKLEANGGSTDRLAVAAPSACNDTFYRYTGWSLRKPKAWYANHNSFPSNLDASNTVDSLRGSHTQWTAVQNTCNEPDRVGMTAAYQGDSRNVGVNISSSGSCTEPNHDYIIGFGDLPADKAMVVCVHWDRDSFLNKLVYDGDIRLNKVEKVWANSPGSNCENKLDVQSGAAKGNGFIWGLDLLDYSNHPNLTMADKIITCDTSHRTLGRGDVWGMEGLYLE